MRKIAWILLIALSTPLLMKMTVVGKYMLQYQAYLLACENTSRPELNCNGTCQFAKELREVEEHNPLAPEVPEALKVELQVISILDLSSSLLPEVLNYVQLFGHSPTEDTDAGYLQQESPPPSFA
ncbi:MAG: hypothetical protein EA358_07615 [Flavobacteriales bacterium]|nr:MAG: hypothetical protein EA358_07615 [Flavobacteriales bacterium]